MSKTQGSALEIARTYVEAIVRKDVETILCVSADDVVCTSPLGRIVGIEHFRGIHDGFARMLTGVTVLAVVGDGQKAVVVYDAETHPVPHAIVAEFIEVKDGRLASTNVIYDATPFAAYAASVQAH